VVVKEETEVDDDDVSDVAPEDREMDAEMMEDDYYSTTDAEADDGLDEEDDDEEDNDDEEENEDVVHVEDDSEEVLKSKRSRSAKRGAKTRVALEAGDESSDEAELESAADDEEDSDEEDGDDEAAGRGALKRKTSRAIADVMSKLLGSRPRAMEADSDEEFEEMAPVLTKDAGALRKVALEKLAEKRERVRVDGAKEKKKLFVRRDLSDGCCPAALQCQTPEPRIHQTLTNAIPRRPQDLVRAKRAKMNKELKLPAKYDPAEERRLFRVATRGGRCPLPSAPC
jgi:hypothetical protein